MIVNNTVFENQGITIWNGNGEIVMNNILVADSEVFSFNDDTRNVRKAHQRLRLMVLVDYNLCVPFATLKGRPKSEHQGPHGITGDPMFVDAGKGVFWLREGSPAIRSGSSQYVPAMDFWGRLCPKDQPPDLGAFPFVPFLATEQARAGWEYGWAYHRHGTGVMPDFWALPFQDGK